LGDIELRPPLPADAQALFPLVDHTPVCDTLVWDGPESFEEYRRGLAMRAVQVLAGEKHFFTIMLKPAGQPIGSCDLRVEAAEGRRANAGLWIGEPFQGRGYGTQTIGALAAYGFNRLGVEAIEADIFVGNWASRRAFEKNGFALTATETGALIKRGQPVDEWMLELTRSAFDSRAGKPA
jgi:ribosomal-protein-alanine N-acetyltransferase